MTAISKKALGRLSGWRSKASLLLCLSMLLGYQALAVHLHERLYFWLSTDWQSTAAAEPGLHLSEYQVLVEALPVAGVASNLSGLSYDADRQQLWAVINNPSELLAMSTQGEVLARYPLKGFQDVEGVAYLGDDLLALADERRQQLAVVSVPREPRTLYRDDYRALTLGLDNPTGENHGFEGLAYDRGGDRLFVVKEYSPRRLYEIRGLKASLNGDFNLTVIDRDSWIRNKSFVTDLSSVEIDESSGHLVLLSDESKLMMELDRDGKLVSYRSLWGIFSGLEKSVPQGEGVTFDGHGNMYLVSEPNLFYAFKRGG